MTNLKDHHAAEPGQADGSSLRDGGGTSILPPFFRNMVRIEIL